MGVGGVMSVTGITDQPQPSCAHILLKDNIWSMPRLQRQSLKDVHIALAALTLALDVHP